jgi:hypothetical protein
MRRKRNQIEPNDDRLEADESLEEDELRDGDDWLDTEEPLDKDELLDTDDSLDNDDRLELDIVLELDERIELPLDMELDESELIEDELLDDELDEQAGVNPLLNAKNVGDAPSTNHTTKLTPLPSGGVTEVLSTVDESNVTSFQMLVPSL